MGIAIVEHQGHQDHLLGQMVFLEPLVADPFPRELLHAPVVALRCCSTSVVWLTSADGALAGVMSIALDSLSVLSASCLLLVFLELLVGSLRLMGSFRVSECSWESFKRSTSEPSPLWRVGRCDLGSCGCSPPRVAPDSCRPWSWSSFFPSEEAPEPPCCSSSSRSIEALSSSGAPVEDRASVVAEESASWPSA